MNTSLKGASLRLARQQTFFRAALCVLAASALPTANAARDCWVDSFGRQQCRLSTGARIGIAIAIIVIFLLLLIGMFFARRRRMQRANQAYVVAQQQQPAQAYGNQYQYGNSPYGNTPYDPTNAASYQQYPPQGQGFGQSYYNPQDGYAPPPGPPPPPNYQEYSPPRNPPAAAKV